VYTSQFCTNVLCSITQELTAESSQVTRTARRASVALGLAPKTKGPEMRSSRKKRAVGNEVHAFLSMVEGGDGDSITRDQYATLLRADLKRLKLGSIESSTIENMLTAIFGNESRLDHEGFERLLKVRVRFFRVLYERRFVNSWAACDVCQT
jgi:hypothetical protein